MRTAFINQLIIEARIHPNVFLLVGDLGFSVVEPFAKEFPDRFLNVGVAEQNMAGVAAGLAKEGYSVFMYSIGNFPTLRCMEQIRYDICYHNLSVTIVSVGGGYSYGALGASHHCTEDLGMLRVIPNMKICAPADPIETKNIVSQIVSGEGPYYLRLGKAGEPKVHLESLSFEFGRFINVIKGSEVCVLSTGAMLHYSSNFIQQQGLSWGLYSVPFIKPLDVKTLTDVIRKYKKIITIEEHQKSGGFGSCILEAIHDLLERKAIALIPEVRRIGIQDEFVSLAGSQEYLKKLARLQLD